MKRFNVTVLILLVAAAWGAVASGKGSAPEYRAWQHVKTMIIQPGHPLADTFGGIHHVFANAKAMTGLASGQYTTDAVFVFELLNYDTIDKTIVETNHKRLDVMRYDPEHFEATGGWEFATYLPDSPTQALDQDVTTACYACHISAQASGYVFSQYRP